MLISRMSSVFDRMEDAHVNKTSADERGLLDGGELTGWIVVKSD